MMIKKVLVIICTYTSEGMFVQSTKLNFSSVNKFLKS